MTTTPLDLTVREQLEEAISASEAADQAILDKGAAAGPDDETAAEDAYAALRKAFEAFGRTELGDQARNALRDMSQTLPNGKTLDDLASETGIINPTPGMSIGEAFVKSDAYTELIERHVGVGGEVTKGLGKGRAVDFAVAVTDWASAKGVKFADDDEAGTKTLITGAANPGGGAFVVPDRMPGVSDTVPLRTPRILQLCTRMPLTGDLLEWVEITTKTNAAAPVAEATSAGGLASAGHPDLITDAAGGLKPESAMVFTERSTKVESIPHWVPFTRRVAADAPQVQVILDTFLVGGVGVKAEDGALSGDGVSPNLRGLINTTNPWNITTFDISLNGNPTRLDAIALAAGQIANSGEGMWGMPDAALINPLDWFSTDFLLAKDSNGQYHGPGPWAALGNQAPWAIQPVVTTAISQAEQVVGAFNQGGLFGDREQAELFFTDSHSDFFARNLLVALAEVRLAFGVRVPPAFVHIIA